ncbi:transferase [Halobaculum sp. WSA2]|uniref:Transferase n=1 Tax=Halobaculum saliterrae TaxID=2073113 RepID=A0A6B0SQ37_9EURY|nr:transferase [Halobaculum saliterrae]MXR40785.1 transferase [Halobaculum saliterrae]
MQSAIADFVAALRTLPRPLSPAGLFVYGVGGVAVLVVLARFRQWLAGRDDEPTFGDLLAEETVDAGREEAVAFDTLADRHRTALAPEAVAWEPRAARVGNQWTTTLTVAAYPDHPTDGYLSGLFELTDIEFDLTVHVDPLPQERARDRLQAAADDLQADADLERSVRESYLQDRAAAATATYKAVENGQRVFSQALFITVRADTRDELTDAVAAVRTAVRDPPARLEPATAVCLQDRALQAAAPIGGDPLDRGSIALGGAVGALLASPHSPTILEEGGVEFGVHKDTRSPLVVDPFAREDGYAMFTVGDPGSGKSYSAKQNLIRSLSQSVDRIGIVLEPLTNWAGVCEALGGRRITVGGTLGLNPLEIKPTPEHVLAARGDDASPLKERQERALAFFTNVFATRGVELGDRRTTLETALTAAYERKDITEDVSTHDRESPTVRDMLDILAEMAESPGEYVIRTDDEAEKIADDAVWLLDQLRPFAEGGQFEQLGRHSEFDIRDESLVYLDLAEQGGQVGGHTSLLMELLITLVYERAKETDQEVVFVIDEARYLMKDAATLSYLETIFRHHRHHDLSIRLVTQTVDEFFEHDTAEMILDQCAIKQFHKLDGMDAEWADEFGLNHPQMRFVQTATPGNEEAGYSQALLGVDGEWRGMEVRALPREHEVITHDPQQADEPLAGDRGEVAGDD